MQFCTSTVRLLALLPTPLASPPPNPPNLRPLRSLTGRRKHRLWEPVLSDPPPLLEGVSIVLVSPKRPISVGTVARSLAAFECEDLRIVAPRCDHLARSSRNGSKGAQVGGRRRGDARNGAQPKAFSRQPARPACSCRRKLPPTSRPASQFLLYRAQECSTLEEALSDAEVAVACTRWSPGTWH